MSKLLIMFLVLASSMYMMVESFQINLQQRAFRSLTYAFEHALHDAALFLDKKQLAEGIRDFDEQKALEVFKETMSRNLPVNDNLEPLHNYFYEEPLELIDTFYIDDNYIDPNTGGTVAFPYIFEYKKNGKTFTQFMEGPSIAYVLQTKVYRMDEFTIKIKVQEYKIK